MSVCPGSTLAEEIPHESEGGRGGEEEGHFSRPREIILISLDHRRGAHPHQGSQLGTLPSSGS